MTIRPRLLILMVAGLGRAEARTAAAARDAAPDRQYRPGDGLAAGRDPDRGARSHGCCLRR